MRLTHKPILRADGTLRGSRSILVDLTDIEHATALLNRRSEQQAALAEVSHAALLADDVGEVGEAAARRAQSLLDGDLGVEVRWSPTALPSDVVAVVPIGDDGALVVRGEAAEQGLPAHDEQFLRALANVLAAAAARSSMSEHLRHLATHDPVTDLPNRTLLLDRIEQARASAQRASCGYAVLFLDLDGFKAVNDRLGHEGGDRLLAEVAEALSGALRPDDTVARHGGDEFAVVCPLARSQETATAIARRLRVALAAVPSPVTGRGLTASFGVALGTRHQRPEALLRSADAAMYRAKAGGGDRIALA